MYGCHDSCVRMSGCQCLVCGCLAVSDVVCGCLAVIDVLCATGDCVLKQRSQPAAVSIPLFNFVTIAYILWPPMRYSVRCKYVLMSEQSELTSQ